MGLLETSGKGGPGSGGCRRLNVRLDGRPEVFTSESWELIKERLLKG